MKIKDLFKPFRRAKEAPAPADSEKQASISFYQQAGAARKDGWVNMATGLGTSTMDKTVSSYYAAEDRLSDNELSALYHFSDLAQKIVRLKPEEMFRVGYDVVVGELPNAEKKKGSEPEDDGKREDEDVEEAGDPDKISGMRPEDQLKHEAVRLGLDAKMLEAMCLGRAYGGAILFVGADDGQDASMPLKPEKVRSVEFLTIFDRREAIVKEFYTDPMSPKFGEPETYVLYPQFYLAQDGTKKIMSGRVVHESRCIRFEGSPTDRRSRLSLWGWTYSVLQPVYHVIRDFENLYRSMAYMVQDANQSVFKLSGVADQISRDPDELRTRMQFVEKTRAVNRAVLLDVDEGEDFLKVPTTFSGVKDIADCWQQRLSAASGVPVTLLMGRSPAGLNATGDADLTSFYNAVSRDQENELKPRLLQVYRFLAKVLGIDQDLVRIECRPLVEMTEKERAELELSHAQKDKLYMDAGVLQPEEVALSRFASPEEFGLRIKLSQESLDARHESLELALENPDFSGTNEAMGLGPDGKPLPAPSGTAVLPGSANPRQAGSGRVPAGSAGGNKPRANTKGRG